MGIPALAAPLLSAATALLLNWILQNLSLFGPLGNHEGQRTDFHLGIVIPAFILAILMNGLGWFSLIPSSRRFVRRTSGLNFWSIVLILILAAVFIAAVGCELPMMLRFNGELIAS